MPTDLQSESQRFPLNNCDARKLSKRRRNVAK